MRLPPAPHPPERHEQRRDHQGPENRIPANEAEANRRNAGHDERNAETAKGGEHRTERSGDVGDLFRFGAHAAQQESFATSLVKACAVSLIPSDSVKYGWNAVATSSMVNAARIASDTSVIISPASAARICAPTMRLVAASATSRTKPRVSRAANARGTYSSANCALSGRIP